ncbi:peptidoglycan-binding domain-containing protein [Paenibacillus sp. FSL R5-0701]
MGDFINRLMCVGSYVAFFSQCIKRFCLSVNHSSWPTIKLWSSGYQSTVGTVDRNFGSGTTSAVKSFQTKEGLTSDGVVGNGTWLSKAFIDLIHLKLTSQSRPLYLKFQLRYDHKLFF